MSGSILQEVDILAIGVHPDDVELCAGGTVIKHIDLGYTLGICDLTKGELGTRGTPEIRLQEAEESAKFLGMAFRINLGMADGFFGVSQENILKLIEVIRACKPKIVIGNAILDRHPDHGRASKLISEACFYSGLLKIETSWKGTPQNRHRPNAVYHYIQDKNLNADFVVDITPFFQKKLDAIKIFRSQFFNPDSKEPNTPISSLDFLEFVEAKSRSYAREINVKYAEAFNVERAIGVNDLFDLL